MCVDIPNAASHQLMGRDKAQHLIVARRRRAVKSFHQVELEVAIGYIAASHLANDSRMAAQDSF